MHRLNFIIGASGSGKTSAVRQLAGAQASRLRIYYFDSIGVPSALEMIEGWGSGESWQRAKTIEWVARIKPELDSSDAILDGQTRPQFILEACVMHQLTAYRIVLLHCSDDIRRTRLAQRGQPDLANDQMMRWAAYLLSDTRRLGGGVIDTDRLTICQTASKLERFLNGLA